jgi:hypothetical protein
VDLQVALGEHGGKRGTVRRVNDFLQNLQAVGNRVYLFGESWLAVKGYLLRVVEPQSCRELPNRLPYCCLRLKGRMWYPKSFVVTPQRR